MKRGKGKSKGGQVTIFIILGIIIVAIAVLIYSFYPQIKTTLSTQEKSPSGYMQTCMEGAIKDAADKLSIQGGSMSPENYITYKNDKIEYLCYTTEYYKPCSVQQPALKNHVEAEIENATKDTVDSCFTSMVESYQKQGYTVDLKRGTKATELLPGRIVSTYDYSLTLTKGDAQKYDSFSVVLNDNLYELVSIATSITEWETIYGDSEPQTYMTYYPNLKVERVGDGDGGKVYILTNRITDDKFQFAVRSQVWPSGYTTSTII